MESANAMLPNREKMREKEIEKVKNFEFKFLDWSNLNTFYLYLTNSHNGKILNPLRGKIVG
jgi:hypothetical protein